MKNEAERGEAEDTSTIARTTRVAVITTVVATTLVVALLGHARWMELAVLLVGATLVGALAVASSAAPERRVDAEIARAARSLGELGKSLADRAGDLDDAPPSSARAADPSGIHEAIARLEARFDEVASAERRAREAIERARRARGILFAGVSHDLKSPLNALLGFADLLALEDLSDEQRESLEMISSRGRELVALVETILDSARVEMGQLGVSLRATDLSLVLEDAKQKANELVHADAEIEIVVDAAPPPFGGDPVHLTRAFALVMAHALKASAISTPAGGVSRSKEPPVERVVVRVRAVDGEVRVDVEHRLRGPSAAALEELYFSNRPGRGLRLGLRLARTIFELHGGHIEVLERTNGRPSVACFIRTAPPPRD